MTWADISEGIKGAMKGDGVNGVLLRAYAMRKGLTVNTSKSGVMHLNGRSRSSLPTFMYGNVALPEKEQFRYLGMLVDKHIMMNLKVSEEHAVRPHMAAQQRTKECMAFRLGCMHAKCGVEKTYEKASCATDWPVLRECSQEPLQLYWFRATVKFFDSMLDSNSEALRKVLKADLHLADRDASIWSAHVSRVLSGMQNEDVFKQKMLSAFKIPVQDFMGSLRYRQQKVWR
eukprot:1152858-Pelagomonas_calceolata.AAC.1